MTRRLLATLGLLSATPLFGLSACDQRVPDDLGRTQPGPGATIRYNLAHQPLPDIPLPNDAATWPDPTSRTGLRINASFLAPTAIERDARERFGELEGWGTFSPISVSFDLAAVDGSPRRVDQAALDLKNLAERHQGDDYDFADDAVYVIDLETGVPAVLDVGAGNFDYTLKRIDRYWANDTRASERNLLFETIDETQRGLVDRAGFLPEHDTDFDGVLDVPNLDDPYACPPHDAVCDDPKSPSYGEESCVETRRLRDRCIADHLLTHYERETDTLLLRPLLPLHEKRRYAVVITDRLIDANGDSVKSPFELVYHASQRSFAERVKEVLHDATLAPYFGDLAGTGLERVSFVWGFTTQPTVEDLRLLRDGLYGQGPFARFATEFPAELELQRLVGLSANLKEGGSDPAGWQTSPEGQGANCPKLAGNLYSVKIEEIRPVLQLAVEQLFGEGSGPATDALLRSFDHVDSMVFGTYRVPFLLEGGPENTDPKSAFNLDYRTGQGEVHTDTVQFWMLIPKETEQHKQPFDVNIYGHGYTGNLLEQVFYAGHIARHGLAVVGINAMGHHLDLGDEGVETLAKGLFSGGCIGPAYEALFSGRARDLDRDGRPDSGGDFWSSYLFHTRDGVRQSVLDHIQLVRILRSFGTSAGGMKCRNEATGWATPASEPCDVDGDGAQEVFGDFDGNGVPDVGGPEAKFGTWGESLGGILSGIHGAIDAYVTSASPGSGGGGLTDIGIRSFQGGVIEAVLLRLWGPLVVGVPSEERTACTGGAGDSDQCTSCAPGEVSLRWVMPDTNSTGELEITCLVPGAIQNTTLLVYNPDNDELRCARVGEDARFRVGIPTSIGDRVTLAFYAGVDGVEDYASCRPSFGDAEPRSYVDAYGRGRVPNGTTNAIESEICQGTSCGVFQGVFYPEGSTLRAPAEGYGQIRQTPALRRFIQLAQIALDPGDPVSFAPYYAQRRMTDPFGAPIASHAVLTVNTIGDMNVPIDAGIAFARATGALPFLRPDQAEKYPHYADYVTPAALYEALGDKTPNQDLIDKHVIEGITALARHPAGDACATSANASVDGQWTSLSGELRACFPTGCATGGVSCPSGSSCDEALDRCLPRPLGQTTCEEALFDKDDLDEGTALYFEQASPVPHRLARYTASANPSTIDLVWEPRLLGVPRGPDGGWRPREDRRLTGLLDAYIVPEGTHTFVNGDPCEAFDAGLYLTNLVARFFQTDGTDLYYLSHPSTHLCLGEDAALCGYLDASESP